MHISELDTPALLIDLDIFERNLARVADYTKTNKLRLRPHTKTHKVPAVGKKQLDSGAVGLTVAKVGEAEVMLGSGTPDLLVAYPVIGRSKLARLADVARKTRVTVALDSCIAANQLSEAAQHAKVNFAVLAEVDVGSAASACAPERSSCNWPRRSAGCPGLTFEGITFYPGHIKRWAKPDRSKRCETWEPSSNRCWTICSAPELKPASSAADRPRRYSGPTKSPASTRSGRDLCL